jgi:hypothetical protein
MIRRAKGLELIIFLKTHLNTFALKVFFTLKIMDFESDFNKSCSYTCDRGHECIIYMI